MEWERNSISKRSHGEGSEEESEETLDIDLSRDKK